MKNMIRFLLVFLFSVAAMNLSAQNGTASPAMSDSLVTIDWSLENIPAIPNPEANMVSYRIEVDSYGNLLSVKVINQTISDELAQKCEAKVRQMSFVQNAHNTSVGATSTGIITFIFKNK